MKHFAVSLSLLFAISVWAQPALHFGNTPTTLITTNDFQGHIGNILGPGNYRFSLYLGPSANTLALTAITTNVTTPGRFEGGTGPLAGFSVGSQVSFQVRGISTFIGDTYQGESTVGFFNVPASGTIELFGTAPGQVGGFQLTPVVPEPSTYALVALAVCALTLCRRRHGKRTVTKNSIPSC